MVKTKSNNSLNPDRKLTKGNMRSKATINRLNMLNSGKAIRNKEGKVVGGFLMMNNQAGGKKIEGNTGRIQPDRRWFGNTRVISPNELDNLREKVAQESNDPYSFILRRKKLPMALLQEQPEKVAKLNILETESFDSVFGAKQQRKRPKLSQTITDYASLMRSVDTKTAEAELIQEQKALNSGPVDEFDGSVDIAKDDLFAKGQSKRIWGELYKVLDSSDVVIEVLDARNIPGTRSAHIEKHLKKNAKHKQLILVINKCDLIPSWATRKWVRILSKEYPTVAFHASMNHSFGKGALITLLRQFSKLHAVS
jgi:nuclear GTP-binding protein